MPLPLSEWERCRGWIEAALEHTGGTHTIGDIQADIESGRALLLAGERSAMVCEVCEYPQFKTFHIWLAGGDLTELRSSQNQLEETARRLGCKSISLSGRRGWERAIADLGYRPICVTLRKEIL